MLVFQTRSVFGPAATFWGRSRPSIASSIHPPPTVRAKIPPELRRFSIDFVAESDTWPRCAAFCVVCFLSLVFLHQWGKLRLKRQRYPGGGGGARNGSSENSDDKKKKEKNNAPVKASEEKGRL